MWTITNRETGSTRRVRSTSKLRVRLCGALFEFRIAIGDKAHQTSKWSLTFVFRRPSIGYRVLFSNQILSCRREPAERREHPLPALPTAEKRSPAWPTLLHVIRSGLLDGLCSSMWVQFLRLLQSLTLSLVLFQYFASTLGSQKRFWEESLSFWPNSW